jgi:hypothetical protein
MSGPVALATTATAAPTPARQSSVLGVQYRACHGPSAHRVGETGRGFRGQGRDDNVMYISQKHRPLSDEPKQRLALSSLSLNSPVPAQQPGVKVESKPSITPITLIRKGYMYKPTRPPCALAPPPSSSGWLRLDPLAHFAHLGHHPPLGSRSALGSRCGSKDSRWPAPTVHGCMHTLVLV